MNTAAKLIKNVPDCLRRTGWASPGEAGWAALRRRTG